MPGPLSGLIPAPYTPFGPDGRLAPEVIDLQASLLKESDIRAVFVGGTTGEWSSLSTAERMALAERWCKTDGGLFQVAVHVGGNNQAECVELARHAREVGATAVAALAPSYFKPATIGDLVEFCVPIAAAAGTLPFYFYDIPGMTNVRLPMSEFLKAAKPRIPNLVGLKFSNTDLVEMSECLQLDGGAFDLLFGADECYLAGLAMGVRGAVGSSFNFAAPLYRRIESAFARGDYETARREQAQSITLIKTLAGFGYLGASKAVIGMLGVECGPVRSPLRHPSREERLEIWERLSRLDVFPRPLKKPE
ncbi:dihydrodipicolinate synthase family protein [Paludisphaera rhizosphaerae]|uniref:dihydrodipicolinate synthase family protein n=1 Tax=Paludisphaera rhizosphaerae TaxID=2711216 RepID=UPI0013EABD96|nr:dihydrodipicolinate synthase family protein [Paludisphaera rhizosphaerae]